MAKIDIERDIGLKSTHGIHPLTTVFDIYFRTPSSEEWLYGNAARQKLKRIHGIHESSSTSPLRTNDYRLNRLGNTKALSGIQHSGYMGVFTTLRDEAIKQDLIGSVKYVAGFRRFMQMMSSLPSYLVYRAGTKVSPDRIPSSISAAFMVTRGLGSVAEHATSSQKISGTVWARNAVDEHLLTGKHESCPAPEPLIAHTIDSIIDSKEQDSQIWDCLTPDELPRLMAYAGVKAVLDRRFVRVQMDNSNGTPIAALIDNKLVPSLNATLLQWQIELSNVPLNRALGRTPVPINEIGFMSTLGVIREDNFHVRSDNVA